MFQAHDADAVERLLSITLPVGTAVRRTDCYEFLSRNYLHKTYSEGWRCY